MQLQIQVEKCKVGPITARYQGGEFRDVDSEPHGPNGPRRVAICGLDNSHNGDYKVAYASDPLLVVTTDDSDMTHDQLQELLDEMSLWLTGFNPIEIPTPDGWKVGFKSLPRSANRLGLFEARLGELVEDDHMLLGGEEKGGVSAYLEI